MIYNNLIYFLIAIVLVSTAGQGGGAEWDLFFLLGYPLIFGVYLIFLKRLYRLGVYADSKKYFRAEKIASILALLFFTFFLFLLDLKKLLSPLDMGGLFPSFVDIAGLGFFFLFLFFMWSVARKPYGMIFGRHYSLKGFLLSNFKLNLPLTLPWIVISVLYDLLHLVPNKAFQEVVLAEWGDLVFFILFLIVLILFSPPLIRRLWGCTPLPAGDLRTRIEQFCVKQNFSAQIYLWPLFEGRVITAGVMGILPRFRYLMLTPAIIEAMTEQELEAVLAHEIGHVKKRHLILYVVLIASFSLWMTFMGEPGISFLFSRDFFVDLLVWLNIQPATAFLYVGTVLVLICMLFFFRVVFGFFMRNFERQADLHVFKAVGNAVGLKSAFEKIAQLSGNIRNKPSWHHFGIGERVDFLELCERDASNIRKQDRKVNLSLFIFGLILFVTVAAMGRLPSDRFSEQFETKYTDSYYHNVITNGSDDLMTLWRAAHYMLLNKKEESALSGYSQALAIDPDHPEILNNSSWLLLTATNLELRNPQEALKRAQHAAALTDEAYILDTLAMAYWANGMTEEAVDLEKQAAAMNIDRSEYYMEQAARFRSMSYEDHVRWLKKNRRK